MKVRNEVVNNFMTIGFKFQAVRIIGGYLEPVSFDLKINLTSLADISKPEAFDDIQAEGTIAFQKLYFWLESVLPGVVMVNATEKAGFGLATLVGNIIMHCPGEPMDELVVRMMHSKLATIVESKLIIGELTISADENATAYTFVPNMHGYHLPKTVKEYINLPSLYRTPWWARKDGFCFEFVKGKNIKEKLETIYEGVLDPLGEYETSIRKKIGVDPRSPASIIEHEKWKPKKI